MVDRMMSDAWREAGSRLSIRVVAPYRVDLPDGSSVEAEAFLPDFGGPDGALCIPLEDEARAKLARTAPLFVSLLGPAYRHFHETLFRETLDDWGWYGPDSERPPWYTGQPWS